MRRIKRPKFGEVVLATRWTDKDINDPWCIGPLTTIIETKDELRYMVEYSKREYRHVFRITEDEIKEWMLEAKKYECYLA